MIQNKTQNVEKHELRKMVIHNYSICIDITKSKHNLLIYANYDKNRIYSETNDQQKNINLEKWENMQFSYCVHIRYFK